MTSKSSGLVTAAIVAAVAFYVWRRNRYPLGVTPAVVGELPPQAPATVTGASPLDPTPAAEVAANVLLDGRDPTALVYVSTIDGGSAIVSGVDLAGALVQPDGSIPAEWARDYAPPRPPLSEYAGFDIGGSAYNWRDALAMQTAAGMNA